MTTLSAAAALTLSFSPSIAKSQRTVTGTPDQSTRPAKLNPGFEAVSIRQDNSSGGPSCGFMGSGFRAERLPLRELISTAYNLQHDYQVKGIPKWADSVTYRIDARLDEAGMSMIKTAPGKLYLALQPMLKERFHLEFHEETQMLPAYTLVVSAKGSKLKEATPDDYTKTYQVDGAFGGPGSIVTSADGKVIGHAVPVSMIVRFIARYLDRPVEDKTGLVGEYTFTMQLPKQNGVRAGKVGDTAPADNVDFAGQSLEASLADMGLEIKPTRTAQEVLVVDKLEPPTPN